MKLYVLPGSCALESYPAIARHFARTASDPDVCRALEAEGLDA